MNRVEIMPFVEHGIEMDLVDLADRADVSGAELVDLERIFALSFEEVPDPDWLLRIADDDFGLRFERALVNAEDAELAHEGVGCALEDMSEDGFLGIRVGVELDLVGTLFVAFEERAGVAFERARERRGEDMQELVDSGAGLGRAEADRDEVSLTEGFFEDIMELLLGNVGLIAVF